MTNYYPSASQEGAYPVRGRRRQGVALHVESEHRDRLREGRAPGVADKPLGSLLRRLGDEIHEAARVRFRERFDEVRAYGIHVHILPGQALPIQRTLFERLDELHFHQYTLDEGREVGQLFRQDGAQRGVLDRRAAEQVVLGYLDATLPRSKLAGHNIPEKFEKAC